MVPLGMPIAVLLAAIMTLGNIGENYELVAIKSSGISLIRFIMPLIIVAVLVSGLSFLFANNIGPVANLKGHDHVILGYAPTPYRHLNRAYLTMAFKIMLYMLASWPKVAAKCAI